MGEGDDLDYFPNELKFSSTFVNDEVDEILTSPPVEYDKAIGDSTIGERSREIGEFLRSLALCH